jgi:hypothetical protein
MTDPDWYAVLGVGRTASQAQVARAFRRLAFRWHPDRNMSNPELAHRQFLLVHQAYEVLNDPARRRAWDAAHFRPPAEQAPARPPPPARSAPPRPEPRTQPAPPPPPLPQRVASRIAWLLLGLVLRLVGFVAMMFVGPLAERVSHDELKHKAPALAGFVLPVGRVLLFGGILLLGFQKLWSPGASPRFAVILIVIGIVIFGIERIALASFWAFGRGRRPRS